MKSSLRNMVVVLFCITLVSSACVGLVYMITEAPIAAAKEAAVKEALAQVLPEFDATEQSNHTADEIEIKVHKATKEGVVVGYAVESATKSGFSGLIRLMVGFTPKGKIINVNVLEHAETPGLGSKMTEEGNPLLASLKGKLISKTKLMVKKDGGDIDALTAATITSRAYAEAISRAFAVFKFVVGWEKDIHATTGATNTSTEWDDDDDDKKEEK